MRVTENLMVTNFLSRSGGALSKLAHVQEQIASGRKNLRPSDDPRALAKSLALKNDLRRVAGFVDNVSSATATMSLTESSLQQVSDMISRARELLVEGANGTNDQEAANAQALELRSLVDSLLLVANRDIGGRHVFGGQETRTPPYAKVGDRVVYQGDEKSIYEEIGPGLRVAVNLTGLDAFQTVPSRITGSTDLDPAASTITPLSDLLGGSGIQSGHIRITDSNGVQADLDLLGATTLGDVLNAINNAGTSIVASLSPDGKNVELTDTGGGPSLSVEDLYGGTLAQSLGIASTSNTGSITGTDLDPAITRNTPMALVLGGAGIGPGTWTLRNFGPELRQEALIDPTQANTVGDLLDLISNAKDGNGDSLGLRARIENGAIAIESTRLHTTVSLSDTSGTSARDLGIAGAGDAVDLFHLFEAAASAVESRDTDAIDRLLRDVTAAVDHTAGMRGTYGARARQVFSLADSLQGERVDLTIRLSDIEDIDLAQAALELTQAQTVYNASLSVGTRLLELNLFNFIR